MTRRPRWWRRELLYLGILAMDATWLTLWVDALAGGSRHLVRGLSLVGVLALLLAVYALTRLLVASRLSLAAQRALVGLAALALGLVLIGLRLYAGYSLLGGAWLLAWLRDLWGLQRAGLAGVVFLGLALYASSRSISLVQDRLETSSVGFSFRVGVVAWFWYGVCSLFGWAEAPASHLLLFFFLGLLSVGLSRVEEVHNGRGAVRSPFTGSWVIILAGSALGAVGLGVVATRVLSEGVVRVVWWALGPVRTAVAWVAYVLADLILRLLMPLLEALGRALEPASQKMANSPAATMPTMPAPTTAPAGVPLPIQAILWAFLLLLFAGVVLYVVTGLRQREADRKLWGDRETAWEGAEGAEGDGLGTRLQRLRQRLAGALSGTRGPAYRLATVREIYASLQRLGAWHGVGREEAETPYEYRRRLDGAWPEAGNAVESITEAYVRAHYGERAFTAEEVEALRAHWVRVQGLVEKRKETDSGSEGTND